MPRKSPSAVIVPVRKKIFEDVPQFPPLSVKHSLHYKILEPDQVLLIPGLLTEDECKQYTSFIDSLPLQLTPAAKKGEAERINYRVSYVSVNYAKTLFSVLAPWLPEFPYPASLAKSSNKSRPAFGLNSNIRLYKYTPDQRFGPHYDDATQDTETGAKSEWTLLIYLTGSEDGVQGGETVFYKGQGKKRQEIRAPLRRGMALLHRHGHECLLHEGTQVLKGIKYVLRSDVMFIE